MSSNGKCPVCGELMEDHSPEGVQECSEELMLEIEREDGDRESESSKHCDSGWMNDTRFGSYDD